MKKYIIQILIVISLAISFNFVYASSVYVKFIYPKVIRQGDIVEVDFVIDANGESVNVIKGSLEYSDNISVKKIDVFNSIVGIWIKNPTIKNEGKFNAIDFSGLIPGGFTGSVSSKYGGYAPGKIFSLYLKVNSSNKFYLNTKNIEVFLNNGKGTKVTLNNVSLSEYPNDKVINNTNSKIKNDIQNLPISNIDSDRNFNDNIPPIIKNIKIEKISNNKTILSFIAEDKGLGVLYSKVRFRRWIFWGEWKDATSVGGIVVPYGTWEMQIYSHNRKLTSQIKTIFIKNAILSKLFVLTVLLFIILLFLMYNKKKHIK